MIGIVREKMNAYKQRREEGNLLRDKDRKLQLQAAKMERKKLQERSSIDASLREEKRKIRELQTERPRRILSNIGGALKKAKQNIDKNKTERENRSNPFSGGGRNVFDLSQTKESSKPKSETIIIKI